MQINEKDPAGSGGVRVSELVDLLFSVFGAVLGRLDFFADSHLASTLGCGVVIRLILFALGSLQCFDCALVDGVKQLEFFVDGLDVDDAADHAVGAESEHCRPYGI